MASAKTFTREEVRSHTTDESLYCIIDSTVYDLTEFVDAHPGGESVLRQVAGRDATTPSTTSIAMKSSPNTETSRSHDRERGSPKSPYFKDSHRRQQRALREFAQKYLYEEAWKNEASGEYTSQETIERMSKAGLMHMRMGPGKHLHGVELLGGAVKGEEYDYFHDLVSAQEMARIMARGAQDGNMGGMTIGLTAVLNFGNDPVWKQKIADEVFSGKKKL
ncbi:unnamed protein product, partial [Clonostachys rosea f. rosea IK726]